MRQPLAIPDVAVSTRPLNVRADGKVITTEVAMTPVQMAAQPLIVIIALALITYQLMQFIKRRLYPWETQQ